MAVVTALKYNHTSALILGQHLSIDNLALMLIVETATFSAAHTTIDDVAGALTGDPAEREYEVYGNGWAQSGEMVANIASSTIATRNAKMVGDQTAEEATGGPIGPCRYVLLYDKNLMKPLILYDLGQNEYAGVSTPFKLTFDLNGSVGTMFTLQVVDS